MMIVSQGLSSACTRFVVHEHEVVRQRGNTTKRTFRCTSADLWDKTIGSEKNRM